MSEALPTEAVYRGVRGAPEEDQGVPGTPHSYRATLHAGEVYWLIMWKIKILL